jgi:hypothetical protein
MGLLQLKIAGQPPMDEFCGFDQSHTREFKPKLGASSVPVYRSMRMKKVAARYGW